jgi:exosome complex component RRP40
VASVLLSLFFRLLSPECAIVNELGNYIPYEIAVGVNGRVWIKTRSVVETIVVTNAILNAEFLDDDKVKRMVEHLVSRLQ